MLIACQSLLFRTYYTRHYQTGLTLSFVLIAESITFGAAIALSPAILYLTRRFSFRDSQWRASLAVHVGASCLFGLLLRLIFDFALLPWYRPFWLGQRFTWSGFGGELLESLQLNVLFYWIIAIGLLAADQAQRSRAAAVEAAELRAQLAETRLEWLRMQLDPHFLFNTLHSISELVHQDAHAAEGMIADLSELLRRSLERRQRPEVTLAEEIQFLRIYLEIQCRRFADRLSASFAINPDLDQAMVPGMLLQPLVENSIRHAISSRRGGGRVECRAFLRGGVLVIEIEDRGGLPPVLPFAEGLGLRNTRERIEKLYGAAGAFDLIPSTEGLLVRVQIPYSLEREHAVGTQSAGDRSR